MATVNEILLISEEMIKLYSPLSRNISQDKVFPFVILSQQLNLTPLLGTALVEELQQQIKDNELTPENKGLLLKIAPYLALDTTYLAMRSLAYSITEKGLTKEQSENSTSLNNSELAEFKLELMGLKEQSKELLLDFLCECRDSYPLWSPSSDICKCRQQRDNDTNGLIYFPSKKPKGCGCN